MAVPLNAPEGATAPLLPDWLLREEQALGLAGASDGRPRLDVTIENADGVAEIVAVGEREDLDLDDDGLAGVDVGVLELLDCDGARGWLRDAALLRRLQVRRGKERLPLLVNVVRRDDVSEAFPQAVEVVGFHVVLTPFRLDAAALEDIRITVDGRMLAPLEVAGPLPAAPPVAASPFRTWNVHDVLGAAALSEPDPGDGCDRPSEVARPLARLVRRAAALCVPGDGGEIELGRPFSALADAEPELREALALALVAHVVRVGEPAALALDFSEALLRLLGVVDNDYLAFQHPEAVEPDRLLTLALSPAAPLIASHHAELAKENSLPGQGVLHPVALTALSPVTWSTPLHPALRELAAPLAAPTRWGDLPPATGLVAHVTEGAPPEAVPDAAVRLRQWFTTDELLCLRRVFDADTDKRRRRRALLAPGRRVMAHACPAGPPADALCPHEWEDLRFRPGTDHLEQMVAVAEFLGARQTKVTPASRNDQVLVSVVLPTRNRLQDLPRAIESVLGQSHENLELIVVDDDSTDGTVEYLDRLDDRRVTWTTSPGPGAGAARNAGAAMASGDVLMWMDSDDLFLPGAVAAIAAACPPDGWCYTNAALWDGSTLLVIGEPFDETRLRFDNYITQQALGISRAAFAGTGGYDEGLIRAIDYDMVLRLLEVAPPVHVPFIGSLLNTLAHLPRITTKGSAHWAPHVRNRALPAWRDAENVAEGDPRVSVIVPVLLNWTRATRLVQALRRDNPDPSLVEIVVVDDGLHPQGYAALFAVAASLDVRVVTTVENQGFSTACNTGALASHGRVLVFLNDDTTPSPGALDALVTHYETARPAAVQGVSVTGDDTFEGLGIVGGPDGLPYALASGLPVDVNLSEAVRELRPQAVNAAFLAVAREDFIAIRGFDPLFRNGMEDIDLSLRLSLGTGRDLHVEPSATIRHSGFGSGQQRKKYIPENRLAFSRRWRGLLQRDDREAWRTLGYEVLGYEVSTREPITSIMPRPVIEHAESAAQVAPWRPARVGTATQRIALVIGTPYRHLLTEPWGDTYLAVGLRRALVERGLQCRVVSFDDPRPAFNGHHLRLDLLGLHPPQPSPDLRQAAWVISHPSRLLEVDLSCYEHVFVASPTWSPPNLAAVASSFLPQPSDLHPLDEPDPTARARANGSAVFVGNSRKTVRPCIEYALDARVPLQVYGTGWDMLSSEPDVIVSGPVNRRVALGLYAGARLVLNDHWPDMLLNGFLSNRVADVLAVGGRVATDIPDGLDARLAGVLPLRSTQEMVAAWTSPDSAGRPSLPADYNMHATVDALLARLGNVG